MAEEHDSEVDALSALLASDGWALLMAHVEKEWGPAAYAKKIDNAIATARTNGVPAEQDIGELGAAARHVRLMVQWPQEQVQKLTAKKPAGTRLFQRRAH